MEAALAAAAVQRQKKKAAAIEAAAKKTEEDRVQKEVDARAVKEDQEAEWLDDDKKERLEAVGNYVDEERKKKQSLANQAEEADWLDEEKKKRLEEVANYVDEERKKKTEKGAAEENADWIDEDKKKRLEEVANYVDEERKKKTEKTTEEQEAEWLDQEKKERIQAAAAKAEEERMAKLHSENEEVHKWKAPKNVGLGKGEKPSFFQSGNYTRENPTPAVNRSSQGPRQTHVGEIIRDSAVKPTPGSIRKFEPNPQAPAAAASKPTTAQAAAAQPREIECVTQADLKAHGNAQPTPSANLPKDGFEVVQAPPPEQTVTTEVVDGVKTVRTTTVTSTTETFTEKVERPPPAKCCVIL